jgi:hypothetical protein
MGLIMDNKIEKEFVEYVIGEMRKKDDPMETWEEIMTRVATKSLEWYEIRMEN